MAQIPEPVEPLLSITPIVITPGDYVMERFEIPTLQKLGGVLTRDMANDLGHYAAAVVILQEWNRFNCENVADSNNQSDN